MPQYAYSPTRKPRLPPTHRRALEFICREVDAGHRFPSRKQIADAIGYSNPNSISEILATLQGAGFISRAYHGDWCVNDDIVADHDHIVAVE